MLRSISIKYSASSIVLNSDNEILIVESKYSFSNPIPFKVPDIPGWLDEQAEPLET